MTPIASSDGEPAGLAETPSDSEWEGRGECLERESQLLGVLALHFDSLQESRRRFVGGVLGEENETLVGAFCPKLGEVHGRQGN